MPHATFKFYLLHWAGHVLLPVRSHLQTHHDEEFDLVFATRWLHMRSIFGVAGVDELPQKLPCTTSTHIHLAFLGWHRTQVTATLNSPGFKALLTLITVVNTACSHSNVLWPDHKLPSRSRLTGGGAPLAAARAEAFQTSTATHATCHFCCVLCWLLCKPHPQAK